jgi:hypothetical protein
MAKKNATVQITPTHEGNLLVKVLGAGEFVFDRQATSLECRHFAELKGWKFTLEDAAAIERDTETGLSATPQMKFDAIKAIAEHYMSGTTTWGRKRAAGEASPSDEGLTLLALMRVKGWDTDAANAWVAKVATAKSIDRKAVLANVRKNPEVILATAAIKAERAAANKNANAADFLAELDEERPAGDAGDDEAPF